MRVPMERNLVITGAAGGIGRALVPLLAGDRLLLTPHRHGTDGFFVAAMERRA